MPSEGVARHSERQGERQAGHNPILWVMERAALAAGRHLRRDFGEVENLQRLAKGANDFVTAADLKSEEILYRELTKARPDFSLLMEERGAVAGQDPTHRWIVDPLDGTRNFAHALPHFAISIALEERLKGGSEIIAALVYHPLTGEIFQAARGEGAFVNQQRLRVSGRRDPQSALIATRGGRVAELRAIMQASRATHRHLGTVALELAYVAAGRLDGFYARGAGVWDLAAGLLLVREAGGIVSDVAGGTAMLASGTILAGTPILHEIMRDAVRRVDVA